MKTLLRSTLILAAACAAGFAQQWEFGGAGGGNFLNTVNVNGVSGIGSATAGFQTGAAFGGYIGYSQSRHLGGEIRYGYLQSNLKLASGGSTATFSGVSHVAHYDLILKTTRNAGRVQLFAALGGGLKYFNGTGKEAAYQPLSQFGYFTKTSTVKPMASVGGGVKFAVTKRTLVRLDVRDYATPLPTSLLAAPGSKMSGWIHDFVFLVGVSTKF